MAEERKANNRLLAALVLVLTVVVIVQVIAMTRMQRDLGRVSDQMERQWGKLDDAPAAGGTRTPAAIPWEDDWIGSDAWSPFEHLNQMRHEMNRMFNRTLGEFQSAPGGAAMLPVVSPDIDIRDEGDHFAITVDLPGAEEGSVDVTIEDNVLTIRGSRDQLRTERSDSGQLIRQERRSGEFARSITLPEPVDPVGMKTEYKNGILTITVQKTGGST